MKRRRLTARVAPTSFTLDRRRFAGLVRKDLGELTGIEAGFEGGIAAALDSRFRDALDAGAISSPPGIEAIVYGLDDALIVAVREVDLPRDLPFSLRQLATNSIETKYIIDHRDGSFDELCAALDELLSKASALLPSFEAMRRGEQKLARRGLSGMAAACGRRLRLTR